MTEQKTYKRETGCIMFVMLAGLFVWGLVAESEQVVDVAKFLTTPVFMFAGAAFGMDAVAKQFK